MRSLTVLVALVFLWAQSLAEEYEDGVLALKQRLVPLAHKKFEEAYLGGNDARAIGNLAVMKIAGLGCERSPERGKGLMILAAHNGDRLAQKNLSTMYAHGMCLRQDEEKSKLWLDESKWESVEMPSKELGAVFVRYKHSTTTDLRFWLKIASDMDHIIPNYRLGVTIFATRADKNRALPPLWASRRLIGNAYNPQISLSLMVQRDFTALMRDFSVLDSSLNPEEYFQLGHMNRYGIRVRRNLKEAYIMFSIAEDLSIRTNDKRKAKRAAIEVSEKLSVAELCSADELLVQRSLRERVIRTHEGYDELMRRYGAKLPPIS